MIYINIYVAWIINRAAVFSTELTVKNIWASVTNAKISAYQIHRARVSLLLGHPVTTFTLLAAVRMFSARDSRRQFSWFSLLLKWANTSLIPINMSSIQNRMVYRPCTYYVVCTFHIFAIHLRIYGLWSRTLRYANISQQMCAYVFLHTPS